MQSRRLCLGVALTLVMITVSGCVGFPLAYKAHFQKGGQDVKEYGLIGIPGESGDAAIHGFIPVWRQSTPAK